MEAFAYGVVVVAAILLSREDRPIPNTGFSIGVFLALFAWLSVAVRMSGFDADIANYAERMTWRSTSFYYVREPIVWFGHRALMALLGDARLVLFTSDILTFAVTIAALRRFNAPQYAYIAIIAFFPFALGMQNVYRQWVAVSFLLYALSCAKEGGWRMWGAIALACLCHNASALFIGPILAYGHGKFRVPLLIGAAIATPAAIILGAESKSAASTGLPLEWPYAALVCLSPVLVFWLYRWTIGRRNIRAIVSMAFMAYVSVVSSLVLASAGAERVSLVAFSLIWVIGVLEIEGRVVEKRFARSALTLVGFAPILATGARTFIL